MKPHKGKAYVTNLFPSLFRVTERNEESIHETLATSLPKILKVLGCFTTENEMKVFKNKSLNFILKFNGCCFLGFVKSIFGQYRQQFSSD